MKHHHIHDAGKYYMVQVGTHPNRVRKTFTTIEAAIEFRDSLGVKAPAPRKPKAPKAGKGTGILGLSIVNGCWLAQVSVNGVRHRRTFGKATDANARLAVAWLGGLRGTRTAVLPEGTAKALEAGAKDAHARIDAWAAKKAKHVLTMAERIAANKRAYNAKRKG
jgi:hypothetical protein